MQLPHNTISPWLVKDTLVSGPSAALNRDPTPTARMVKVPGGHYSDGHYY